MLQRRNKKYVDLSGQKFNRLTVSERTGTNKQGAALWKCSCDCGSNKEVIASTGSLRGSHVKSCGCILLEKGRPKLAEDGITLLYPCYKCKGYKEEKFFYKNKTAKNGLQLKCKKCTKVFLDSWRKKNPEKFKEQWQIQAEKNHEKITNRNLLRKIGITLDFKKEVFKQQECKCAACGSTDHKNPRNFRLEISKWHSDHDHKTGKFRGVLCHPCNVSLGQMEDNIEKLEGLVSYLKKTEG